MSFERPIRLLREGLGSVAYSEPPGAPAGFVNLAGARNGASVDSAKFVVLGQDISAAGSPAQLLSNREIPGEGFYVNLWGASGLSVSAAQAPVPAGVKLFLQDDTSNGVLLQADINPPATDGADWMQLTAGGVLGGLIGLLNDDATVVLTLLNLLSGDEVIEFSTTEMTGVIGPGALINICGVSPTHTVTGGSGQINAFIDDTTLENTGGTTEWVSFAASPTVGTGTANDTVVGFLFDPLNGTNNPKYVAFENTIGNVLLCTKTTGGSTGKVGVRGVTAPAAWVHIGAGAAAAGSSPLKLTAGPLLTIPETGALEYDGTHLYFTIGLIRNIIV
jgi:hypothetical protein